MIVSFCHDLLVDLMCDACDTIGITSTREYAVETASGIGFIDLVASYKNTVVAIEIERSNRRIEADVAKAIALSADELLVVVPNPQVERLVNKRLRELNASKEIGTFVACYPQAIKQLRYYFPLQL
jgi:hypothetical protein